MAIFVSQTSPKHNKVLSYYLKMGLQEFVIYFQLLQFILDDVKIHMSQCNLFCINHCFIFHLWPVPLYEWMELQHFYFFPLPHLIYLLYHLKTPSVGFTPIMSFWIRSKCSLKHANMFLFYHQQILYCICFSLGSLGNFISNIFIGLLNSQWRFWWERNFLILFHRQNFYLYQ